MMPAPPKVWPDPKLELEVLDPEPEPPDPGLPEDEPDEFVPLELSVEPVVPEEPADELPLLSVPEEL